MTKRQRNGNGSITERKGHPGSPFQGRIYVNGRRVSVYGRTQAEVQAKIEREKLRGKGGLPATDERLTLAKYVEAWLQRPPGKPIKPRTKLRYEQLLRLHVVPVIGSRKLSTLQPEDVERVFDRMRTPRHGRSNGFHPTTIVHARAALQRVLRDALRANKVSRNVASRAWIDLEAPEPRRQTVISPDDRQKLLAVIAEDRLAPLYIIAFATGARLGEICGLRWRDVEWQGGPTGQGQIRIEQTVGRVGTETFFGKPKNSSSARIFPMNATIRAALLDQKRRQEWGLTGDAPLGLGGHGPLVFTSTTGGPLTGSYVTQHLQKLLAAGGLPRIRFHDARHSFVSWAADAGIDVDTISKLVGHSSTAVTRKVYLHVFERKKADAVEKLDALFASGG
jgi:integrase